MRCKRGLLMNQSSTSKVTLHRASITDLDLVRQSLEEVNHRNIENDNAILDFLSDRNNFLLLAMREGRVLGALNGYSLRRPNTTAPQFFLYEINVHQDHR